MDHRAQRHAGPNRFSDAAAYSVSKNQQGITLSASEQAMYDRVPEISSNLLANIPRLEQVAQIIRNQHKHYDGSGGGDDQSSGDDIPIASRMLKVLLDWRQIETSGVSRPGAFALMRTRYGWYDPKVLEATARYCGFNSNLPPVPIRLAQLKVGHVLASNMETDDGKLLIALGHQITSTLLEKIHNYSTFTVIKEPFYVQRAIEGAETKKAA
jgi:hypothetical protein